MKENFDKVKGYISELGFDIIREDTKEELIVIEDESRGIKNLVVDCEGQIIIFEQHILNLQRDDKEIYKKLLQFNRNLIHGAFVLDANAQCVIYRDTLQIENIDLNEIEGTLSALGLGLVEHAKELIEFSK